MNPELTTPFTREEILSGLTQIFNAAGGETFKDNALETLISDRYKKMDDLDRIDAVLKTEEKFNILLLDEEIAHEPMAVNDYSYNYKLITIGEWVDLIELKIKETNNPETQSVEN